MTLKCREKKQVIDWRGKRSGTVDNLKQNKGQKKEKGRKKWREGRPTPFIKSLLDASVSPEMVNTHEQTDHSNPRFIFKNSLNRIELTMTTIINTLVTQLGQPGKKRLADSLWCRSTTDWFWTIHKHIKCKRAMLTYLDRLQSRRLSARLSIMYVQDHTKPWNWSTLTTKVWNLHTERGTVNLPKSQPPRADYVKFSLYPWTAADWNALPQDPPWGPARSQLVPSLSQYLTPNPHHNRLFQHSAPADFVNTSNTVLFILSCTSP